MKIGISAIGYECREHLDAVLEPWINLKKEGRDIVISAAHGIFPETAQLGFPLFSTDGTIQALYNYQQVKQVDNFVLLDTPAYEKDIRNSTLPYLFERNIDLLWLLDLQDEIYTVYQINSILSYVQNNPNSDWFKINFKNYVIRPGLYVDDFVAPRIWRTNVNGGIAGFYYDNDIVFQNGRRAHDSDIPGNLVPRDVAFVKHYSWVGSPEYLKRKLQFQINHYRSTSYKWDEGRNCLDFDMNYYIINGKEIPTLYEDKEEEKH